MNSGYAYPYGYGYGLGYGTGPGYEGVATVGEPTPYEVESQAPEPLDEEMTPSPGDGYAWIDGYWHWSGDDWVWVSGRWEQQQDGYVYVQPYYDYSGASYVYTPGYWAPRNHVPIGWIVRGAGNGHPATLVPPSTWHNPTRPIRPIGGQRPGGVTTTSAHGAGTFNAPARGVGGYQQLPGRPIVAPPVHNQPGPIEGGRNEPPPVLYDRPPTYRPAGPTSVERPPMERPSAPPAEAPHAEPSAHPTTPSHSSGSRTSSGGHHR